MTKNMEATSESTELKEAHQRMLRLLEHFDAICQRYKLIYWIDYGTLLGAVRHSGFIPWDDDLDISMPRSDYEKFLAVAEKELPETIFLQTRKTDPHSHVHYAKLRDRCSTFIEDWEEGRVMYSHQGIFIDIFPVNFIRKEHGRFYKTVSWIAKLFWNRYMKIDLLAAPLIRFLNGLHCEEGCILVSGAECMHRISLFERNRMLPVLSKKFEGILCPVPKEADYRLREVFGDDYMVPPPPEKRRPHSVYIDPDTPCDFERRRGFTCGEN